MTTLLITRGLPSSGKTTLAREWVADKPRRARVNRDDLRAMLFDAEGVLSREQEEQVSTAQQAMVTELLKSGISVVCDDTNLRAKYARAWADLAVECGAEFEVLEVDTPVEECVRRDAVRHTAGGRSVGADVIRMLDRKFRSRPPIEPTARLAGEAPDTYVLPKGKPEAWIVDLDGTLALMGERRGPYDEHLVHLDLPNPAMVAVLEALQVTNAPWTEWEPAQIIFMSGRSENCRADTEAWLRKHASSDHLLLMRAAGDQRRDAIVKAEIFDTLVRKNYRVLGVFDDRNSVVSMWRRLGLTCFQVAEGNF